MHKLIFTLLLMLPYPAIAVTTDELVQIHQLTTADRLSLSTPIAEGTLAFDTSVKKLYVYANNIWQEVLFAPIVVEKTSNYILERGDNNNILTFNSPLPVTLTIPTSLPVGYNVSIYQTGIGKVTIIGATGVTVLNRLSRFKTAGKDAGVGIVSTSSNTYHLTGDLKK